MPIERRTLTLADGSAGYVSLLVLVMASAVASAFLVRSYPAMLQAAGREYAPPTDEVVMVGFGAAVFSAFALSLVDAGLGLQWLSPLARRVTFVMLPPLMLIFLVLGTVYLGVATPPEAGALGAVGAVARAAARRRLTRRNAALALLETSKLSCMVMFVLIGATFFSHTFQALDGRLWIEHLFADLPGGATGFLIAVTVSGIHKCDAHHATIIAPREGTMKAYLLHRYGKACALQLADIPAPDLRDDEVLVRVHAAGVNQLDTRIRDGEFKLILPYRLPLVLGHDVAGEVVQVGASVRQFKVGDAVYARVDDFRIGTFAEFVPVKEDSLAMKPSGLSMEEAASVPLVGLTAWQALVQRAQLKRGQKVFIQGGSGGVGTFAIQLAKHLGATVATTTSAANAALVKSLGADVVIDYRTQDFEDILSGYDVVLNSQDSATLEKSLRILKPGGKLISISGPPDPAFGKQVGASALMRLAIRFLSAGTRRRAKKRGVEYSFLFMQPDGSQLREIAGLLDTGALRAVVDRVFPFTSTNEALEYVASGRAKGKAVVAVR